MDAGAQRLDRSAGANVFGSDAAGYHAGRIGYSDELYDAITARLPAADEILEIGPGTGLATRILLDRYDPRRLTAVEADAGMAHHLRNAIPDPSLDVVASGFLEAAVDGPFDLAACAAAFHWLPPEPTLARLRTLLRPGATLALWWNSYRQVGVGDPFADAVTPLLADLKLPPSEGPAGHYSLDVGLHRRSLEGAGFVNFAAAQFRRERILTLEDVRRLYASYSYVRVLPTPQRENLVEAIVALAADRFGDAVPNVVLSALYLADAPS